MAAHRSPCQAVDAFNRRFDETEALSKIAEWWDEATKSNM
jgi:hypothetical protein